MLPADQREQEQDVEGRWRAWLLARNRRGTRALVFIGILYPAFFVLDYLAAPREALPYLFTTRILVTVATIVVWRMLGSKVFERFPDQISAGLLVFGAVGISGMTVFMGGLASPYYAGLSLIIVATGLLFVWPPRVVLLTHGLIVASFVLPNIALARHGPLVVIISNLFFLVSTAIIISAGQILSYRAQREQLINQLLVERTKARLEEAHEQLKRLDQFKSQFFANVTHELKTPLAMILTPLELLLQEAVNLSPAQRATLHMMFRSGMKLLRMIGDLLDLSKLEESKLRLRIGEHDLGEFLRTLVAQTLPLAQRKDITLSLESAVERSLIHCDLERIERVFINLISNAIKFTPDGGHVFVRLRDSGDWVHVEVVDDGCGFPSDMEEKVFERFFQVDMGGARNFGGTGIGLALARELVELHGGRIWAKSEPEHGASFFVELRKGRGHLSPSVVDRRGASSDVLSGQRSGDKGLVDWVAQVASRSEFKLLDINEVTERRVADRDPDEDRRAHSVLVVEDTPEVARIVHTALRRLFKVLIAPDGVKGLALAQRELPSLIVTDLMMPGLDGRELTRALRADPRTRHIPIIMLTARGDLEDRVAGLETGVNAYLTKPFSARELVSCASSLLGIQETTADLVLTQQMDSFGIVAGGLAHEINNPLSYVKAGLERSRLDVRELIAICQRVAATPSAQADEQRLQALSLRMERMFETATAGIRRISRTVELMGKYGRQGYSRVDINHDLFADLSDIVTLVAQTTGRAVEVTTEHEGDGTLECVPEEVQQLVTNLAQNAIEAVPDGSGRVSVRGFGDGDSICLSVKDNGSGIKTEDQKRIFTPFFTTKAPGRGMGLGLTIVWRVVQSLHGTIKVVSVPGEGSEFIVRVPRKRSDERRQLAPLDEPGAPKPG